MPKHGMVEAAVCRCAQCVHEISTSHTHAIHDFRRIVRADGACCPCSEASVREAGGVSSNGKKESVRAAGLAEHSAGKRAIGLEFVSYVCSVLRSPARATCSNRGSGKTPAGRLHLNSS
jgi:hypothetical protein